MQDPDKIIQLLNTQRDAQAKFNSIGDDKVQMCTEFKDGRLYLAYAYLYRELKDADGKFIKHEFFERVGLTSDIDQAIEIAQAFFESRVSYVEERVRSAIVNFNVIEKGDE